MFSWKLQCCNGVLHFCKHLQAHFLKEGLPTAKLRWKLLASHVRNTSQQAWNGCWLALGMFIGRGMEVVFNVFHDFIDFMLAQLKKMVWRKLVRLVRSLSDVSVASRLDTLVALFQGQRMTGLLEKHSAVAMRPYPPSDRAVCSWGSILALLASAERMLTIVTKCHKVIGISCWPKLCIGSMEPSI